MNHKFMILKPLYWIYCFIREHDHNKEIIIDENTTRCGNYLEFDWSYVNGYKIAINTLLNFTRKHKWNKN